MRKARRKLAKGRCESALFACDFAIEMDGENAEARALVHEVQRAQIGRATAKVEARPDDAQAHLELAGFCAAEEEYAAADRHLRAGLRLMPRPEKPAVQKELLRLRGRVSCGLGSHDRALDELRRGDEPGFVHAEIQYYAGLCQLALGRRLQAFEHFEELIAKNPWIAQHRLQEFVAEEAQRTRTGLA